MKFAFTDYKQGYRRKIRNLTSPFRESRNLHYQKIYRGISSLKGGGGYLMSDESLIKEFVSCRNGVLVGQL